MELKRDKTGRVIFTKKMKQEYTILLPTMLPIHFELIRNLLVKEGFKAELLTNYGPAIVQEGLKYVHNDTCYPALMVIGQMIDALNSGKYDPEHTALMITQTGGGCRASNYIFLLRKALRKAGFPNVPVISLNMKGMEKNPGFKLSLPLIIKGATAITYGDMLMLLSNHTKAYEITKGDTERLTASWIKELTRQFNQHKGLSDKSILRNLADMAESFQRIPMQKSSRIKVGIVGEIYVKYSYQANNGLEDFLLSEGCEVMVPGLMGFFQYSIGNVAEDISLYGGSRITKKGADILMRIMCKREDMIRDILSGYPDFTCPSGFYHMKSLVKGIIGYGTKMGEGWLLPAEMLELIELGFGNIVCTQPFGCLPNHICGKAMIHSIKTKYKNANIVAVDYDPGATQVNQENRIKLMLAVAKETMAAEAEPAPSKESSLA